MTAKYIEQKRGTFGTLYILHATTADGRDVTRPLMVDDFSRLLGRGVPVVRGRAAG